MQPNVPSTIPNFPSILSSSSIGVPISAGIPIVLARIAVCELTEPFTLTKDNILSLSIWTVSDGARSSATMITGSSAITEASACPLSILIRRSDISFTSADLPLIYSSSMAANIVA